MGPRQRARLVLTGAQRPCRRAPERRTTSTRTCRRSTSWSRSGASTLDAQQRLDASKRAEQGAEGASPGAQALEDEADSQGAFNPETGEINWDCPCLGGMAHGPCGEQFRAAFSCFVYSTEEPKGMDCIDKFKWVLRGRPWGAADGHRGMQDCFREHPDIYGEELDEDDEGREGKDGADGKDGGVTAQNKAVAEDGAPGDEAGKPKNKVDVVSDHSEQKTSDKSTEAAPTPGGGAKDDSSPIRAAASDATEAKAQHKPGTTGESAA